jgi:hypothetical protein
MSAHSRFLLRKWYLDCVTADGSAWIGYWARLRWGALSLSYAALLHGSRTALPTQRQTLRPGAGPRIERSACEWTCAPLGLHAAWKADAEPVERVLLRVPGGGIRWRCHMPNATVRLGVTTGAVGTPTLHEGRGYVEELELTVPPWRLPFRHLIWGRFTAAGTALVWLQWRGESNRQVVVHDGAEHCGAKVGNADICMPHATLSMSDSMTLRAGPLGSAALRGVPRLVALLPARFRDATECKQLSRGILREPGRESIDGWAIHEVVQW